MATGDVWAYSDRATGGQAQKWINPADNSCLTCTLFVARSVKNDTDRWAYLYTESTTCSSGGMAVAAIPPHTIWSGADLSGVVAVEMANVPLPDGGLVLKDLNAIMTF